MCAEFFSQKRLVHSPSGYSWLRFRERQLPDPCGHSATNFCLTTTKSAPKRHKTYDGPAFGAAKHAGSALFVRRIRRDFSKLSSAAFCKIGVIHSAVPFVQHRLGIQQLCLWEAAFFIAWWFPMANVKARRRGASPSRPVQCPSEFGVLGGRGR